MGRARGEYAVGFTDGLSGSQVAMGSLVGGVSGSMMSVEGAEGERM